jgi:hypothetical protein
MEKPRKSESPPPEKCGWALGHGKEGFCWRVGVHEHIMKEGRHQEYRRRLLCDEHQVEWVEIKRRLSENENKSSGLI